IFLSEGYQLSALDSASVILLGVFGLVAGGLLNGSILALVPSKTLPLLTAALLAIGLFLVLSGQSAEAPAWSLSVCLVLVGLCFGGISNSITVIVRHQVPTENLSFASA